MLTRLTFQFKIKKCAPAVRDAEQKLSSLRQKMRDNNYAAFIIPSEDEHQSEYVANYDKRRQWVSGKSIKTK